MVAILVGLTFIVGIFINEYIAKRRKLKERNWNYCSKEVGLCMADGGENNLEKSEKDEELTVIEK